MSDEILVERRDHIATVVFNRPRMRNAFNLPCGRRCLASWTS